jgi:hypothetical protein
VYADGFTNIVDVEFGPDGTLYVAEMVHAACRVYWVAARRRLGPCWPFRPAVTGEQRMALGGLAVGDGGSIYVSANTLMPGASTIVRITP